MEMNGRLKSESLSTAGRYSNGGDSFVYHQDCQVDSSCRNDNELIRMQLRRLWKTVLNKNEKSRFEERKLCRTKTIKFLRDHIFSPCERVRYLALDLLCGMVPRLEEKTDILLQPLTSKVIQCLSDNSSKEVQTKALHFLRTYARHTKSVPRFLDLFFHFGIESTSDSIKVNSFYGINVILDQDIGDKLYSRLVQTISGYLKGNSHPLVFLACYRVLGRIHEQIEDVRFYKLLDLVNQESKKIYINFLNFEETDPYLNAQFEDLVNLITEYQKKRNKMRLNKDFDIIDPIFFNRISVTNGCERAVMVKNFEVAIRRGSWTENELESHIQDFFKLISAFLLDPNRLIQISGLEILKETVQRMGFHLSPFLGGILEVLLVPLSSSNIKIKAKTEKLLLQLMKSIHPMTVIWELLDERETVHKESVLIFLSSVLKSFSYYELDLACLVVTIGRWMEVQNPGIRNASRDCIRLLFEIIESSPVPNLKTQAVSLLIRNCRLHADTLRSVGISVGDSGETYEDSDALSEISHVDSEQSTMQTLNSYSTVTRNSTTNQLQSQTPRNHDVYENNDTTTSFSTAYNDSFHSIEGEKFSDIYLSKLTLKSTKIDNQSCGNSSLPVNSTGQLQSETSHRTSERNADSTSFQTDTTYGYPHIGLPRHNSTPRKRWNASSHNRKCAVLIAAEASESSAMDTFESGNDTLLFQKSSHQAILKNEAKANYRIQQNQEPYVPQYAAGSEWNRNYSSDQCFQYCEENGIGDPEAVSAKSRRKRSKSNDGMQSDGDPKCIPSTGCYVESLDPKKFNFNILQISTPKTMESIDEENEIGKFKITEVLSSCVSTPRNSSVSNTFTNQATNQLSAVSKKKKRQRTKFTEVRSPANSTCSSMNDPKSDFVIKTSKLPTKKNSTGKIFEEKVTLPSTEPIISSSQKVRTPANSTCSSMNDTKCDFVTKTSKRPTKKKDTEKVFGEKVTLPSTERIISSSRKVRSPANSTCSPMNDTKSDFITKTSKRPTKKKGVGKIFEEKGTLPSTEPVISSSRKDDRSYVANEMKVPKMKCLRRRSKNKNVSTSSIEKSHVFQPEVISDVENDKTLDTIFPPSTQESCGKALSLKTESDINQQFLEVVDFESEPEYEKEASFKDIDCTLTEEGGLNPDSEISEVFENTTLVDAALLSDNDFSKISDTTLTIDDETISDFEAFENTTVDDALISDSDISKVLDKTLTIDDETISDFEVPENENSKLNDCEQNESNVGFSGMDITKDSHLSTVDEKKRRNSSPGKKDKITPRTPGELENKINKKNKTKEIIVDKTKKSKTKPVLKKMTRSIDSNSEISFKKTGSSIAKKRSQTITRTSDEDISVREIPKKPRKRISKSSKKPADNECKKMLPEGDDPLEDAVPFTKGKQLPRTPVNIQENNKISTPSRDKEGKPKTSAETKMKAVAKNKKIPKESKTTEVKRICSTTWKKTSSSTLKEEEDEETSEIVAVENILPEEHGEFAGCQWRRDLEYAVKGGVCIWAQRFEMMVEKMTPFKSSEIADSEMKKSLEDLNGKSWKAKEEAMSVVIRLAKHHPLTVYDNIPKFIVGLCNEVKNFRQSVAGKAVLTLGYMYEYLGKKLDSKLRLAVGALLAKSGNRTLAAYFRLVIKSLFKIINSTSPQKAALAFIQEGGRHPNKASRETAAQFLVLLTITLGPYSSLASHILAGPMIKCTAQFVFDCSALTRYCGKRMFQILMLNPNFEKLKDRHLDISTAQNLTKVLEQIETKGVSEELLPINIIK